MRYILSDALTWRNAMTRTILALALVAILAGCDTTDSSPVPSGNDTPILRVIAVSGTDKNPALTPIARIEWEYQDSIYINVTFCPEGGYVQAACAGYKLATRGSGNSGNLPIDLPVCYGSYLVQGTAVGSGVYGKPRPTAKVDAGFRLYCTQR